VRGNRVEQVWPITARGAVYLPTAHCVRAKALSATQHRKAITVLPNFFDLGLSTYPWRPHRRRPGWQSRWPGYGSSRPTGRNAGERRRRRLDDDAHDVGARSPAEVLTAVPMASRAPR
jgi:hypothetical protein